MQTEQKDKILVLATPQKNAIRLIEYGYSLAQVRGAELHILHVQQGNSVFDGKDTPRQLQNLVNYGGKLGACVHVQCENDVAKYVGDFVREKEMSEVVLGEAPAKKEKYSQWDCIIAALPKNVKIHVVERERNKTEQLIV